MRIGIDIMWGDYAPHKTVHGAILALNELPSDTKIVLFGRESEIHSELKQYNINANNFEIISYNVRFDNLVWNSSKFC